MIGLKPLVGAGFLQFTLCAVLMLDKHYMATINHAVLPFWRDVTQLNLP